MFPCATNGVRWLLLLTLLFAVAGNAATKPVMVHYMPWFVAKPYHATWGWHWTMNHFNPEILDPAGVREIASWYHPLIGPYDSSDPAVLEYHVLLMKLAGIDGVIVDWYGADNYADYGGINAATAALFTQTRRAGLKFALCFEDQTVLHEIAGGFLATADAVTHTQSTLRYAETNYFRDPSHLRWNNHPVLLNFGPEYFKSNAQWQSIFSVLAPTNQPAFFTEDNRLAVGKGAFTWPPMGLTDSNHVLLPTQLTTYLADFEQTAQGWPAFVSSAFPRFHDIYAAAGVQPSYGGLEDRAGATLRETLARAMTNASALIQLVTWNDFGEGTVIEPTREFGYRDLGIVQDLRRQYLDSHFAGDTNDLALATRYFRQRVQTSRLDAVPSAELDRVFTNLVTGARAAARRQLDGLDAGRPAVYAVSSHDAQVHFSLGGHLAGVAVAVQTSTNLTSADWQTLATLPITTNQMTFDTPIEEQGAPRYFRARLGTP